jgi:hypothetical protein
MNKGVLIFAFNNESFDYLKMAAWSAENIHRHLDIPVCVVTNSKEIPEHYQFDQVIQADPHSVNSRMFGDYGDIRKSDAWYNSNRVDAYSLTPYDHTLVLDADYIVASNQLNILFDIDQDFLSHRYAYDVTNRNPFDDHNYFGSYNMPMWWATVMSFKRGSTSKLIFDSMTMIREHWNHYRNLYGNDRSTYRNDHALSIALGMVNGHTTKHSAIPWGLATVLPGPKLSQTAEDCYQLDYLTPDRQTKYMLLQGQDIHVMGKFQLGDLIANSQ